MSINIAQLFGQNSGLIQTVSLPIQTIAVTALGAIIAATTTLLATSNYNLDLLANPNPLPLSSVLRQRSYDFIVVGAGSAGAVVANRLSENGKFRVLLLEAGGKPLITNSIPILAPGNINLPETDWLYKSVPQRYSSLAMENNRVTMARGRSLGGTSNLNFMMYMRGNPNDYDNWSNLLSDPQWSYDNVLPFFRKSENYRGNYPDPIYHGTNGPLSVTSHKGGYEPLINEWVESAREFGFNTTDPNARQTSTFFKLDSTIKDGRRHGTFEAFLQPILERPNLKIISYATVQKINLDSGDRATGVTYIRKKQSFTVISTKEVILCAGAIGTPQLLLLSGIGASEHLKSVGVKPQVDLPGVGENLQDHILTLGGPFLLNDTVSLNFDRETTVKAVTEYFTSSTGVFAFNAVSGGGFFNTEEPRNELWPNVAAVIVPFGFHSSFPSFIEGLLGLRSGITKDYYAEYLGRDATLVGIYLGRPESRGTVRLASNDQSVKPLINLNYFSDRNGNDLRHMVRGYQLIVNMLEKAQAWRKYDATYFPKPFPGCESFQFKSYEYFECFLRHVSSTVWHFCCTAKMGHSSDPMAVLDSNLRVRKVRSLRVADTSVMPAVTNGNTNAPAIMIGEKAADLILRDWSSIL